MNTNIKKFNRWLMSFELLILVGCSAEEETAEKDFQATEESNIPSETASSDSPKPAHLEPPDLLISIDGENLRPARGSYSWSADMGDGTGEAIEAQSPAPPHLVEGHTPREVTPNSEIELNFETPPDSYEIKVWTEEGTVKSTTDQFRLSEQQGKVIYEVAAEWAEGDVHYAFTVYVSEQ